jgi:hypothetical protein
VTVTPALLVHIGPAEFSELGAWVAVRCSCAGLSLDDAL